jgi:hypothetical protein
MTWRLVLSLIAIAIVVVYVGLAEARDARASEEDEPSNDPKR